MYSIYALLPAAPISCRSGPGRCTAHAACLQDARGFVRGKSSDAVWPGLEAYRRWSPFLHLFALLSALDLSALDMMIASGAR